MHSRWIVAVGAVSLAVAAAVAVVLVSRDGRAPAGPRSWDEIARSEESIRSLGPALST